MDSILNLDSHWLWLIAAAILGIIEILAPGFFMIWLGAAAFLTGLITVATDMPLAGQFATFALLSVVTVYAGRRWFASNPIETSDPLLNDRAARLIGDTVTVVEAIEGGSGRVKVGDGVWTAYGADASVGVRLRVTGSERGGLKVEPI